ncbi:Scr1 family TA system antitoxin-like transcriptional regulator [Streptomyces sp. BR123]|uniref:Scr1 family TA system antitoxin-like transcriptional regulator n=1 Tax=Streptomyces sp. BR123 TaxID=2749828 RepID=UPI002811DA7B|nr:Scr1 family TA system antitoxin-like transcriptional regulator [Streptomyces sp. BR123]
MPGTAGPVSARGLPESVDSDVVHVEGLASALYVESPADVAVYNAPYEHLRAHALPLAPSVDLAGTAVPGADSRGTRRRCLRVTGLATALRNPDRW